MNDTDKWFGAAKNNDVQTLQELLGRNFDINYDTSGHCALWIAADLDNKEVVKFMLENGANADQQSKGKHRTALMTAAIKGNISMMQLLLDYGASVNVTDPLDSTAYDYAESYRQHKAGKFLWEAGGRPGALRTVLVLGAGFTKGFFPNAPVLVDDFGIDVLLKKYAEFPAAVNVLKAEQKQAAVDNYSDGNINLERLMTRLDGGMPYDSSVEDTPILQVLLTDLKNNFVDKIAVAVRSGPSDASFGGLAKYCVEKRVNVVTFNYDETFDSALENGSKGIQEGNIWYYKQG